MDTEQRPDSYNKTKTSHDKIGKVYRLKNSAYGTAINVQACNNLIKELDELKNEDEVKSS